MTDQLKQLSEAATLTNRLRGIYAIGPDVNGKPEFGFRDFGSALTPRIQLEAADRIEALEAQLTEARAREAVAYEVVEAIISYEIAETAAADTGLEDDYYHVFECWDVVEAKKAAYLNIADPDHTTTALEQIKQQARDEEREAMNHMAETLKEAVHSYNQWMLDDDYNAGPVLDRTISHIKSVLATLSADTPTT